MTRGPDTAPPVEPHRRRYRQAIPRPPSVVLGGSAPWAALADHERRPLPLTRVRNRLAGALVPVSVEPEVRPQAAVLVALHETGGDTAATLIRRSPALLMNPGDLAFPGGRLEPREGPAEAALREAHEEVGLEPASVELLGSLPVVNRRRHSELVQPFVGILRSEPTLTAQPNEVEAVLTVPLSILAAAGAYWEERWNDPLRGEYTLSFFADPVSLGDDVVWGMTAGILRQLLTILLVEE